MQLLHKIGSHPIIAAVRKIEDLETALNSSVANIFFMGGTVKEIVRSVELTQEAGKGAFVHIDLIRGLSNTDRESVEWIAEYVGADGIVTPKGHLIKEAKRLGLFGILHLFILDSGALENGLKLCRQIEPDGIELMPGVVEKILHMFSYELENTPIIASGLIQTEEEATAALSAGATSLSVSSELLWNLRFDQLSL
ncbi:glycerol-3-phosphate responsive antiterminator GlpP [Paenibacillus pectinilyticus]|uniref:Glycerol uptake operon antiterminator regulatory protein n=1 Tax=Paenibacillus pectinilyticus TaxID=512399 RepID=A0A1C1A776_9BACL|nr:glycerol-3-phosphate responsive antiterminator [Paenibacillus pectinilyticus]OCT16410.1 glycerol-3-phosphate responsive antiterminator GlpP [Paenibacillus pectinilyticus]